MDDFLNWYLNTRSRVGRGMFSIIITVAFLPFLWVPLSGLLGFAQSASGSPQKVASLMSQAQSGDVSGLLNSVATGQLDIMGTKVAPAAKEDHFFNDLLQIIVLIGLYPIVCMRLRDLGKWMLMEQRIYAGLFYAPMLFPLLPFEVSSFLSVPLGIISFFVATWMCAFVGEPYIPPSERIEPRD